MATFWHSLMQKVQSLRERWAKRREETRASFPYRYRTSSIPQQLIRALEDNQAE